jgi:taurine transport system substrate-binding protein
MQRYAADPQGFAGSAASVGDIVKATGAKPQDVPDMLAGNSYPPAEAQRRLLEGDFVKAVADTAAFLKDQGKIDVVLPDYHAYATARFLP